jgi:hypothetical protein
MKVPHCFAGFFSGFIGLAALHVQATGPQCEGCARGEPGPRPKPPTVQTIEPQRNTNGLLDPRSIILADRKFSLEEANGECLLAVTGLSPLENPIFKLPLELKSPCWFSDNEGSKKGTESRKEGWRVESAPGQPQAYALFETRSAKEKPHYVLSVVGSPADVSLKMVNENHKRRAKDRCGSELRIAVLYGDKLSLSDKLPRAFYCSVPAPELPLLWILTFPDKRNVKTN